MTLNMTFMNNPNIPSKTNYPTTLYIMTSHQITRYQIILVTNPTAPHISVAAGVEYLAKDYTTVPTTP